MAELMARSRLATSEELADAYRPLVTAAIETLGPRRCMFESNCPVDRSHTNYRRLWNAFKILASSYSADERRSLMFDAAAEAYDLAIAWPGSTDSAPLV
jgi:predicted TIM-barrel fold metal-dependent hydrolase